MERNESRAWKPGIHLSHIAHNTLSLNPQILHNCLEKSLETTVIPRRNWEK